PAIAPTGVGNRRRGPLIAGQLWKLTLTGDGSFRLTNRFRGDGLALDTRNDGVNDPEMAPTGPRSGQFWKITPVTGSEYRFTNEFLGERRSLEARSDRGHRLVLGATADLVAQRWTLTRVR